MQKLKNKTIVVKIGNNHIGNAHLVACTANNLALLRMAGANVVLVHGGGPKIAEMVAKLGANDDFIDEERVTDDEVFEIVEMVLRGHIAPQIVTAIQQNNTKCLNISGRDMNFITAEKIRRVKKDEGSNIERILNLGLVGKPTEMNIEVIYSMFEEEIIPVISPIATNQAGKAYSLNADVLASFVAQKLEADKLIILSDYDGIPDKDGEILSATSADELESIIQSEMVPVMLKQKALSAIEAVRNDVSCVHILNGQLEHVIMMELLGEGSLGTIVYETNEKNPYVA